MTRYAGRPETADGADPPGIPAGGCSSAFVHPKASPAAATKANGSVVVFRIRFTGVFSYAGSSYGSAEQYLLPLHRSIDPIMIAALLFIAVTTAVPDSLRPDAQIREVVLRHATEVRACYENEGLSRNSTMSGTVEIEVRILPVGRVDSAQVTRSDLTGAGKTEVADCIAARVRNWRFARGPYAVEHIILPFSLKPTRSSSGSIRAGWHAD